jgi:hypothetical protein
VNLLVSDAHNVRKESFTLPNHTASSAYARR